MWDWCHYYDHCVHGTCENGCGIAMVTCSCDDGWTGKHCESGKCVNLKWIESYEKHIQLAYIESNY